MPIFTDQQRELRAQFEHFLHEHIQPNAQMFDDEQCFPRSFFSLLAKHQCLGAAIPEKWGGFDYAYPELGLMHEILGQGLASLQNIVTVAGMVSRPLAKFGTDAQCQRWLPKIASGETLVSLALTEPHAGSDFKEITTQAEDKGAFFCLNGTKKYITLGQVADLFLVLCKIGNEFTTILVERTTPGVVVNPIQNILGLRSNMLAEIQFHNCEIPKENLLGRIGNGLSSVVVHALDEGRYTTAWGCVGLAQACLDTSRHYAQHRKQSNVPIDNHQLVQKLLTEMIVETKAARELCFATGQLRKERAISYISETLVAKYFSARMVVDVSARALQIFGAAGFTKEYPIERYWRDAKAMEVIEGTPQIHELSIPKTYFGLS